MSVKTRILQYIENKGVSKYQFYKDTGIANGFLDKEGNIGSDKCEIIYSCYPDINLEWLIVGNGDMLKKEASNIKPYIDDHQYGAPKPYIDTTYADCGIPNGFSLAVKASECDNIIIPFLNDYDFSIRARGDSMINRSNPLRSIRERDIVACKLWNSRSHIRWGEVYALATSEGVVLKKIIKSSLTGCIRCVSFNVEDGFDEYDLPLEEIHDWALVVGVASVNIW